MNSATEPRIMSLEDVGVQMMGIIREQAKKIGQAWHASLTGMGSPRLRHSWVWVGHGVYSS